MEISLERGGPVLVLLGVFSVLILAIVLFCFIRLFGLSGRNHPILKAGEKLLSDDPFLLPEEAFDLVAYSLRRGIAWLAHLANLSTLGGLLGTVLGIQEAFVRLEATGMPSIGAFAGGIHEAISTTIVGLCLAIPALVFHHLFRDRFVRLEFLCLKRLGEVRREQG